MKINTVTVLGANGSMGSNVAGIFASFGGAKVYLVSRKIEDSILAQQNAVDSVRADSIRSNLIPKTYEDLSDIIPKSDLIFESVTESIEIKRDVYNQIMPFLKDKTIIGTGSSGLSIDKMSEYFDERYRSNYFGIHMFNPPYSLSLCELIPNDVSDADTQNQLVEYLENILLRDVVVTKDMPAFLGNRVGFKFMNKLLQLAEEYSDRGGIDYIDTIFGGFTGRSMAPLHTINFVGLDVHKAIVDNIANHVNEKDKVHFSLPTFFDLLLKQGSFGQKVNSGLYKTKEGVQYVFDIETQTYRVVKDYKFDFIGEIRSLLTLGKYKEFKDYILVSNNTEVKIIKESMLTYVIYGLKSSLLVSNDVHAVDVAMATGFGWIPPLAIIDLMGGKEEFRKIINGTDKEDDYNKLYSFIEKSKYDYRKFIKAR